MSRPIIALCSLIALVGCVPEIRTSPADVPDAGDLGPVLDLPTDQPLAEVAGDGALGDQGDAGQPDVPLVDVSALDVVSPMDVLNDAGAGTDASTDRTLPSEATVLADVGSDASAEDRSCGVCVAPHAVSVCRAGSCAIERCETGFADCDMSAANGCEIDIGTSTDCGACGRSCVGAHVLQWNLFGPTQLPQSGRAGLRTCRSSWRPLCHGIRGANVQRCPGPGVGVGFSRGFTRGHLVTIPPLLDRRPSSPRCLGTLSGWGAAGVWQRFRARECYRVLGIQLDISGWSKRASSSELRDMVDRSSVLCLGRWTSAYRGRT